MDITQCKEQREKRTWKNEQSSRDLWENIKNINICITRISEGKDKELESEKNI
jgi:hypothetical protein